jgi:hypothetical protein
MGEARHFLEPGRPPPDGAHVGRFLYGLMQPLMSLRLLLRNRTLLRAALVPVFWIAAFCAVVSLLHVSEGPRSMLRHFYRTFAVLAPLPSVLMAGHYARLAVQARGPLGLPPAEPYLETLWQRCRRAIAQAILIALGLAPLTLALHFIPLAGSSLVKAVAAVWALHWIVIDAFDATRVLRPGESPAAPAHAEVSAPPPWFVRALLRPCPWLPLVGRLLRRFARWVDRMARPWRDDIAVVEAHPLVTLGFALTTAALLATPILNLFFRPIVLIGAVHLLARIEPQPAPTLAPALAPA